MTFSSGGITSWTHVATEGFTSNLYANCEEPAKSSIFNGKYEFVPVD
jgi:hypothetical protein